MSGAEGVEIGIPRTRAGQIDERTYARARGEPAPAPPFELVGERASPGRIPFDVSQGEDVRARGKVRGKSPSGVGRSAVPDDHVEVVGPHTAHAEELDNADRQRPTQVASRPRQRGDGDRLRAGAYDEHAEPAVAGQVLPPGEEPLPRQEERIRRARREKCGPLLPQLRERLEVFDGLDVSGRIGVHEPGDAEWRLTLATRGASHPPAFAVG